MRVKNILRKGKNISEQIKIISVRVRVILGARGYYLCSLLAPNTKK